MSVILDPGGAPIGSELYVLGFPVKSGTCDRGRAASNQSGPAGPLGDQHPVYRGKQRAVRFSMKRRPCRVSPLAAIVSFDTGGGNRINVTRRELYYPGLRYCCEPAIPDDRSDYRSSADAGRKRKQQGRYPPKSPTRLPVPLHQLPETFNRSFAVSENQGRPSGRTAFHHVSEALEAEPGYRITSCTRRPRAPTTITM